MICVRALSTGLILTALLAACQGGGNAGTAANQLLLRTDNAFSTLSANKGFAAAFQRYAADNALLLPENRAPLSGKSTIVQSLQGLPAGTQLSWTPQGGETSGDLGYTWGVYTFTAGNAAGQTTAAYGKYLSVWKEQAGNWKLAVMMINQSPGPAG